MAGFLGIDHPLIVVRDIDVMRERYAALGFTMTAVGRHPWGTSTSLAMFDRCLLELMSIYDESLTELNPAGDVRFGEIISRHLAEREGISMQALNSDDAAGDSEIVVARGTECQGTIEFGRDVVLPDGRPDRTATTLKMLYDRQMPRLSTFICQQHRPELIYVPKWMEHPNGTIGICQVTVLATQQQQPDVRDRYVGLYGADAISETDAGFDVRTGNGIYRVQDRAAVEGVYGVLVPAITDQEPCCVAIHVRAPNLDKVIPFLDGANVAYRLKNSQIFLAESDFFGNVFLVFENQPSSVVGV